MVHAGQGEGCIAEQSIVDVQENGFDVEQKKMKIDNRVRVSSNC
jgi:hypothetical protein